MVILMSLCSKSFGGLMMLSRSCAFSMWMNSISPNRVPRTRFFGDREVGVPDGPEGYDAGIVEWFEGIAPAFLEAHEREGLWVECTVIKEGLEEVHIEHDLGD
jgi:hypothetical protein